MSQVETVQLDTSGDLDDDDRTLTEPTFYYFVFFSWRSAQDQLAQVLVIPPAIVTPLSAGPFFFPVGHVFRLEYPLIVS